MTADTQAPAPAPAGAPQPPRLLWYLGAMNDARFIIDGPPLASTDGGPFDWPEGPNAIAGSVDGLAAGVAEAIVQAHNVAIHSAHQQGYKLGQATPAPTGDMVLVPREPTQMMWAAFRNADEPGHISFHEAYRAMLAAAPSPSASTMGVKELVWEPITSAPKDGTTLLLFADAWRYTHGSVQTGYFDAGQWYVGDMVLDENDNDFDPLAEGDDEDDEDALLADIEENVGPTHWMHLPDDPGAPRRVQSCLPSAGGEGTAPIGYIKPETAHTLEPRFAYADAWRSKEWVRRVFTIPVYAAPIAGGEGTVEALRELLTACEEDCGLPTEHDGDDEPVGASIDRPMSLTFGMLRRARAAVDRASLTPPKAETETASERERLVEALGKAAQMAGDACWSRPMPKNWDRDAAEYTDWCADQAKFIREEILALIPAALAQEPAR